MQDDPAKRYDYFETNRGYKKNNNFYGERTSCPNGEILIKSWLRGFYNCGYCFCLMDEKSENSDRFFSLQEVVSDVEDNKVVTGVRFVKEERVFYMQIQQATLLDVGLVDVDSLEWKEVDHVDLLDDVDGEDFFTVDSDHQSMNLDNVESEDPTYIVTGVKFGIQNGNLKLEVRITKYDFESGELISPADTSKWISVSGAHE